MLVPATHADARRLFDLRNDPFIIALSRSGRAMSWNEHEAWFASCLAQPTRHRIFFLQEDDDGVVGALRFDRKRDAHAEITIFLLERATGRGLGSAAIAEACALIQRAWKPHKVVAHIIDGNDRSMRAFQKAGFSEASAEEQAEGWSMVRRFQHGS